MNLVQGRLGYVTFQPAGGTELLIPVYNWSLQSRRGRVTGDPVGGTFSTNFADGMTTSRFTAQVMPRRSNSEAFSSEFLDWFVNRIALEGLDDTKAFTIKASDGAALHTLTLAKPESFTITIVKGQPVGLSVVFVSPKAPTKVNARAVDGAVTAAWAGYGKTPSATKLVMFNAARFFSAVDASGLAASTDEITDFYNFELTFSNNHLVNAPLDGTLEAKSFDAGVIRAGLTLTLKAYSGAGGDLPPLNSDFSVDDPQAVRVQINIGSDDTPVYVYLDLARVVPDTDNDASANTGASYRTWQCLVLGDGGAAGRHLPVALSRSA